MFVFRQRLISTAAELKISGLKKILGLEAGRNEYRIVYGPSPNNSYEIAVLTRSLIEIIIELSSYIHIPEKHIEEGRSFSTFFGPMDKSQEFGPLIEIKSQDTPQRTVLFLSNIADIISG